MLPTSLSFRRLSLPKRSRLWLALYLLMLPTIAALIVFGYYPKVAVFRYALFRWDGGASIEEFRGLRNFQEIWHDHLFWQSFKVVGILFLANLVKMWPSIFAAIVLHRLKSPRWQYVYRVLLVVPMVIPSLVVLLIWKSFFDPTVGILNILLNRTGMMKVLHWLDSTMPAAAGWLEPVLQHGVAPAFGNAWGLALVGVMALLLVQGWRGLRAHAGWWILLAGAGLLLWGPLRGALTIVITITCGVLLGLTPRGSSTARGTGIGALVAAAGLLLLGTIWTEPTEAFRHGSPAWLGDSRLVIPAVILWGFPWIGTVGVLIYLAGLQNISQDVYEAAELDGLGAFGKMFRIELPLIMTQVRINLVFMTIGTLGEYVFFMVLLGADGGPRNVGMVPGLYMYREAFINTRFGYSCALGVVLFALLLAITVLFQRYVRVEK